MPSTKQAPASIKPAHIPVSGQGPRPSTQIEASSQRATKISGQRRVLPGVRLSQHIHMRNEPLNIQQLAPQMSGHIFTGNQKIIKAAAIMGSVGKTDKRHVYTGNQTVLHNGFSVMGDVSANAALDLREPKKDHDHEVDPDDESDETEDKRDDEHNEDGTPKDMSDPWI